MIDIRLPLSQEAAKACVAAAVGLGVEPWEIAVHVLATKQLWELLAARATDTAEGEKT